MERKTKAIYDSPKVEVVEMRVEQGFATSGSFTATGDFLEEEEDEW